MLNGLCYLRGPKTRGQRAAKNTRGRKTTGWEKPWVLLVRWTQPPSAAVPSLEAALPRPQPQSKAQHFAKGSGGSPSPDPLC